MEERSRSTNFFVDFIGHSQFFFLGGGEFIGIDGPIDGGMLKFDHNIE